MEVDSEESGNSSVQGLDDDRHVSGDRGCKRDDPIGRDPKGIDEVGDQKQADDNIHQEVGNVRCEIPRELSSKAFQRLLGFRGCMRHGINCLLFQWHCVIFWEIMQVIL